MYLFLLRDNAENFFLLLHSIGVDRVMGKQAWKKAGGSGGQWKDEDDVMLSYILPLVSDVRLASKKNRPKLLAIHPRCHSGCIFIL